MTLELDESERKLADDWITQHVRDYHNGKSPYAGPIGGWVSYVVTYTTLGTIVSMECARCRAAVIGADATRRESARKDEFSKCLTDFLNW